MISKEKINAEIKNLTVEALHGDGCWVYTDDPNALKLFGYKESENKFVDDLEYDNYRLVESAHNEGKVWIELEG